MGLRDRLKKYCILKKVRDSSERKDDNSLDEKKETTDNSLDEKEVKSSTDNKTDSSTDNSSTTK